MSIKFYKRLIVVVYTLILLIPTIIVGVFAFDFKTSLNQATTELEQLKSAIIVDNIKIGKIGVMEVYKNDGKSKPLVIVQHAINAKRQDVIKSAYRYAEAGYFVVAPDLYAHGDRKAEDKRELVMQGAVNTSKSYDSIIEYYIADPRCNTDKFGITGYSLGGMVAFHYAAYGTYRPTAVAPCISTPNWQDLEKTYLLDTIIPTGDASQDGDAAKIKNAKKVLSENSPINNYDKMKDIHILMQNGGDDNILDAKGVTELYYLLSPLGTDITLMIHEKQGHIVPDNNIENIVDFFDRTLK